MSDAAKQKTLNISKPQLNTLFGNLDQIITVNTNFLKDIVVKVKLWEEQKLIGEVLKELTPHLKLYGHYLDNYNNALAVLNEIRKDPVILEWLRSKTADPVCDGLNLDALLIQPIQRIPRYRLFLQRLLSCITTTDNDYQSLNEALALMEDVAVQINAADMIEHERNTLLTVLEKFDTDTLFKPGRKFLNETDIQKVDRRGTPQKRHVYLFNDILIIAHPQLGQLRINKANFAVLKLKRTVVSDIQDGRYTNLIGISSAEYSCTAITASPEHKAEWLGILSSTITQAQFMAQHTEDMESRPAAVSYQPDYEAKGCTICSEKFTITFRRHHCRQCGRVVCQTCSKNRRELVPKTKLVRVCSECFQHTVDWRPPPENTKQAEGQKEQTKELTKETPKELPKEQSKEEMKGDISQSIKSMLMFDRSSRFLSDLRKDAKPELVSQAENPEVEKGISPRDKKREKKASPNVMPREKSIQLNKTSSSKKEKTYSFIRSTTEKLLERTDSETTSVNSEEPPPLPPKRKVISELIETNKTRRTTTLNQEEIMPPDSADENEHLAFILRNFQQTDPNIDAWLQIISRIAAGKLDPSKFPKSKAEFIRCKLNL
uniref:Uncharacterized protein n=1 Tax=Arcella intermedia TaxID=1963864 RepID=A0A6B2L005_9EUKA